MKQYKKNYIIISKWGLHFPTLGEWVIADDHNLFETINGYQLKLLPNMSLKYSKWVLPRDWGYHIYNWPTYYLSSVSKFSTSNLMEIQNRRQYSLN